MAAIPNVYGKADRELLDCIEAEMHKNMNGNLFQKSVETWINTEEVKLNKQLAEIQKKLEILKSVK